MKKIYNESNHSNSNSGLIIFIIILIITILGLIFYILYDKGIILVKEETNVLPESTLNTDDIKIYKDYELVYDSNYENGIEEKSYIDSKNNYRYIDDIVVPFININSDNVILINKEINELYNNLVKEYENNLISTENYIKSNYTYVLFDDIVSILIKITRFENQTERYEYKTYNIDLNSKSKLSYSALYKKLVIKDINKSITKDNIEFLEASAIKLREDEIINANNIKVEEEIENIIEEKNNETRTEIVKKQIDFGGLTYDEWVLECVNEYELSKKENTNSYFLSKEGVLNIIVNLFDGKKEYSCSNINILQIDSKAYKNANIK